MALMRLVKNLLPVLEKKIAGEIIDFAPVDRNRRVPMASGRKTNYG